MATAAKTKKGKSQAAATPVAAEPQPIIMDVLVMVRALVYPEPTGGFSVIVPALEGCYTQGDTIEEVQANIREAAELCLETMHDDGIKKL